MSIYLYVFVLPVQHLCAMLLRELVCLSRRNVEVDWGIGVWVPGWNVEISGAV